MPTPKRGEKEKDFVARCVPAVIREGTAKDGSQASAICHSMYREAKKDQRKGEDAVASVEAVGEVALEAAAGKTETQTLLMAKKVFPTRASAKAWASEHGFRSNTIRETTNTWRLRQRPPEDFDQGSFAVVDFRRGVRSVVGRPKGGE